ncbi:ABC transporter substrate-binding protein [Mycetocola sp. JXN-3]|uniref:ABC transporter substrate-binding protein n=1 Tax=Mycetocola sp. JXN-3 TaxID=2116510 RepID=UPI00165D0023|nr:ABC transporter substrate-binding protein [Mycetocola sp. JXN-3]
MSSPIRKKLLATAGAALAFAVVLTGCSAPAQADEEVSIEFYYPDQVGTLGTLIDGYLKEFAAEHPKIKVKGVYSGDYDQTLTAVNTAIDGGKAPALAIMDQTFVLDLVERDAISSWDDYLKDDESKKWLDGFYPQFMKNSTDSDGHVWGVPFARSTIVQYWNKDYFTKAGLDPEHGPATRSELLDAARATQEKGGSKYGLFIPTSTGTAYWLYQALVQQAGGDGAISNADGTKVTLDTPENVKALEFWASLGAEGIAPSTEVAWSTSTDDFLAGQTAMLWTTSGRMGTIQDKATFDWGVSALPKDVAAGAPTGGGSLMLFNKGVSDKQREAAVTLAKFLTTPERAADVSVKSGYIATSDAAWNDPAMVAHVKKFPQAIAAHDAVADAIPEMSTLDRDRVVYQTLAPALQSVLLNGADAKEALTKAQADITKILAEHK